MCWKKYSCVSFVEQVYINVSSYILKKPTKIQNGMYVKLSCAHNIRIGEAHHSMS
jgi:hypothetical protein